MTGRSFDEFWEEFRSTGTDEEIRNVRIAEMSASAIDRISKRRISLGMTQKELAEKCGLKQAAISRIETAQVMPRLDTLANICYALGMEIFPQPEEIVYIISPITSIAETIMHLEPSEIKPHSGETEYSFSRTVTVGGNK